jgi:hypothetical protein
VRRAKLEDNSRRTPTAADLGVITGLALYCALEFGSTGSFGWQRSSYVSATEAKAAILLGIASGFAAAGWWFIRPLYTVSALRTGSASTENGLLPQPQGLRGNKPSKRSLPSLLVGEAMVLFFGAIALFGLAVASVTPLLAYVPVAVPYLLVGTAVLFVLFLRSRIGRLRRLIRTGAEVEGRLLYAPIGWGDGPFTARYAYSYRGQSKQITNTSVISKGLALRHGKRVIVLCDPRNPGDAVILGRLLDARPRKT